MIPGRRSGSPSGRLLTGQLVEPTTRVRARVVLEVVAHAAQEVVLRRVQLAQALVLVGHPREQLGVAQADPDDRREQLQEVLVGAVPARGGRGVAHQQAQRLGPGPKIRANRQGIAGDPLFGRDGRRVAQHDPGFDQPEGGLCVRDREVDQAVGALTGQPVPTASTTRATCRLRQTRSVASWFWRSARRPSSSSARVGSGVFVSPAAMRSSVVASARNGAVRLPATTNAIPTPSSAAMTNAASRFREQAAVGIGPAGEHEEHAERGERHQRRHEQRRGDPDPERDHVVSASRR